MARYSQSQVDLLRQLLRGSCEKKVEPRQHVLWLKNQRTFYFKDVRWVGQLQAAKVSGMSENPLFFKIFQDRPA